MFYPLGCTASLGQNQAWSYTEAIISSPVTTLQPGASVAYSCVVVLGTAHARTGETTFMPGSSCEDTAGSGASKLPSVILHREGNRSEIQALLLLKSGTVPPAYVCNRARTNPAPGSAQTVWVEKSLSWDVFVCMLTAWKHFLLLKWSDAYGSTV